MSEVITTQIQSKIPAQASLWAYSHCTMNDSTDTPRLVKLHAPGSLRLTGQLCRITRSGPPVLTDPHNQDGEPPGCLFFFLVQRQNCVLTGYFQIESCTAN